MFRKIISAILAISIIWFSIPSVALAAPLKIGDACNPADALDLINGCPIGSTCTKDAVARPPLITSYSCKSTITTTTTSNSATTPECPDDEVYALNQGKCVLVEDYLRDNDCVKGEYLDPDGAGCQPASTSKIGSCDMNAMDDLIGFGAFFTQVLAQGAVLITLDTIIGALNEGGPEISFLGIGGKLPAGLFEGLSDTMDFLLKTWLQVVLWGIAATIGVMLGSMLIWVGLDLNSNFLMTNNATLEAGHGIVLSLVNIGFVVALVVIGIMVILRRKEWDIGKTLPRFIAAVILVNFGLFIAKVLIDISSQVMIGFIGNECLGANLFKAFSVHRLNLEFLKAGITSATTGGGFQGVIFGLILGMFSNVFATVFSIVGALTTLGIAIFLILRYVVVTILLIFMPIAWLGFAVPKLSIGGVGNPWTFWWKQFIQWLILGPLMAFFLYLGSSLTDTVGALQPSGGAYPLAGLLQAIVAIVISAGGLFAASKMSGMASALTMGGVGLLAGGAIGMVRKSGGAGFRGQLSAQQQAATLRESASKATSEIERIDLLSQARSMERKARLLGGFGGAATSSMGLSSKALSKVGVKVKTQKQMDAKTYTDEKIAEAEKYYADMTDEEKAERFNRHDETDKAGVFGHYKKLALLKGLQKSGKLNLVSDADGIYRMKDSIEASGAKFRDYEVGMGMNQAMFNASNEHRDVARKFAEGTATAAERDAAYRKFTDESTKWVSTLKEDEIKKLPLDTIYGAYDPATSFMRDAGAHDARQQAIAIGMLKTNPANFGKLLNVKSENFESAGTAVKKAAETIKNEAAAQIAAEPNSSQNAVRQTTIANMDGVISKVDTRLADRGVVARPTPPARQGRGGAAAAAVSTAAVIAGAAAAAAGGRAPTTPGAGPAAPTPGTPPSGPGTPGPVPSAPGTPPPAPVSPQNVRNIVGSQGTVIGRTEVAPTPSGTPIYGTSGQILGGSQAAPTAPGSAVYGAQGQVISRVEVPNQEPGTPILNAQGEVVRTVENPRPNAVTEANDILSAAATSFASSVSDRESTILGSQGNVIARTEKPTTPQGTPILGSSGEVISAVRPSAEPPVYRTEEARQEMIAHRAEAIERIKAKKGLEQTPAPTPQGTEIRDSRGNVVGTVVTPPPAPAANSRSRNSTPPPPPAPIFVPAPTAPSLSERYEPSEINMGEVMTRLMKGDQIRMSSVGLVGNPSPKSYNVRPEVVESRIREIRERLAAGDIVRMNEDGTLVSRIAPLEDGDVKKRREEIESRKRAGEVIDTTSEGYVGKFPPKK